MLALYLACLLVGGVFVGLSTLGGVDKDTDADGDAHMDMDADADFDADADADLDADADADGDVDAHAEAHLDHDATLAEASHGVERGHKKRKRLWIPFLSFSFWTFFAAFFGLTGTVLSLAELSAEPFTAALAGGTGFTVATLSTYLVRMFRAPVGETVTKADFQGRVGKLLLPLKEGGVSKVRLNFGGRERDVLAVSDEPLALPKGSPVMVTSFDDEGRAHIVPENNLYLLEEQ